MKKQYKLFLILTIIFLIAGCREKFDPLQTTAPDNIYYPDNRETRMAILSPKEGDSYITGSDLVIKWQTSGPQTTLKIQLFKDGEYLRLISVSTTDNSSLIWTIPNTIEFSRNYKIKLIDKTNSSNYIFSPSFTITQNQ